MRPGGPNPRRVSPSPPCRTTSPPTPDSRGTGPRSCWRALLLLRPGQTTLLAVPTAAGRVHRCCRQTVRRCPGSPLEAAGYSVEQPSRASNPTGRLIHLTCREPDWERPRRPPQTGWTDRSDRLGSPALETGWTPKENRGRRKIENRRIRTSRRTITTGSDPHRPRGSSPTPVAAVPLQAKVPAPAPAPPVIEPPQPELSVLRPGPSPGTSATPGSTHCQRFELGPERPTPRSGRPRPGPSPPLPAPRAGLAPLDARAIGCRPGPSCSTSAIPVSNPAKARAWATRGPPCDQDAPSRIPGPEPRSVPALPLTPEQQARLAAMPVASRDQVLLWLATGDPILVAEARKKLAPLRPCPEAPRTLARVVGEDREDPSYPALAASGLAAALQDQKSYSGYLRRCEEAWRGELNPDRLLSAYEQAMGPKARNRGAIFMVAVRQKE